MKGTSVGGNQTGIFHNDQQRRNARRNEMRSGACGVHGSDLDGAVMETDIIRRAVEICPGFDLTENQLTLPSGHYFTIDAESDVRQFMLDALAAALVMEVLAAGYDFSAEIQGAHFKAPGLWINIHDPVKSETHRAERDGRDDVSLNTIRVCVEFLEGRADG